MIGVSVDAEIETPPAVDAGLPEIAGFVVLLGLERRMAEVLEKEHEPPINSSLDHIGGLGIALEKALGIDEAHLAFLEPFHLAMQ
jgi:hypothetical protein